MGRAVPRDDLQEVSDKVELRTAWVIGRGQVCTRHANPSQNSHPSVLGFRSSLSESGLTACVPHRSPSSDHGCEFPATEGSGSCPLIVECGHRSHEYRQGGLKHDTSQGRFWHRQYSSSDDQGTSAPISTVANLKFTCVQDSLANKTDYVDLGLACADVCKALDHGMNGRRVGELSQSVFEAIGQLNT